MYSPRGGNLWVRVGVRENGGERVREREREKERERGKITRQTDLCFCPHFYFCCWRSPFSRCNSSYQPWSANKAISQRLKRAECCWPALHPQFLSHLLVLVRTLYFSFHSVSITCCCQLPLVPWRLHIEIIHFWEERTGVFTPQNFMNTSCILQTWSANGRTYQDKGLSIFVPCSVGSVSDGFVFLFVVVPNLVLIDITILVKAILFCFLWFYFALILSLIKNYKVIIRCTFFDHVSVLAYLCGNLWMKPSFLV